MFFFSIKIWVYTQAAAASSKTNPVTTKSSETVNVAVPISEKSELKDMKNGTVIITQVVDKTTTPNDKAKVINNLMLNVALFSYLFIYFYIYLLLNILFFFCFVSTKFKKIIIK